jgi:hypothetical protein
MKTTITKTASLDVISDAMENLYKDSIQKRAQEVFGRNPQEIQDKAGIYADNPYGEPVQMKNDNPYVDSNDLTQAKINPNYYTSGMAKINQAAKEGSELAKKIQLAVNGKLRPIPQTPFDVTDPILKLDPQEAYAVAGQLVRSDTSKGKFSYPVNRSKLAGGAGLMTEVEKQMSGAKTPDTSLADSGTDIHKMMADIGVSSVGGSAQKTETAGGLQNVVPPDMKGTPAKVGPMPEISKKNSIALLNTIRKVADVLDESGYELSAMAADELLDTFVEEAKSDSVIDESMSDSVIDESTSDFVTEEPTDSFVDESETTPHEMRVREIREILGELMAGKIDKSEACKQIAEMQHTGFLEEYNLEECNDENYEEEEEEEEENIKLLNDY